MVVIYRGRKKPVRNCAGHTPTSGRACPQRMAGDALTGHTHTRPSQPTKKEKKKRRRNESSERKFPADLADSRWLMYTSELSSLFLSLCCVLTWAHDCCLISCDLCLTHIGHVSVCFALAVDLLFRPVIERRKKERKKKKKKFTWRSLKMSWFQAVGITFFYCCKSNKLLFIGLANDARDLLLFEFGVWALWAILTPFFFIYIFSGWGLTSPFHLDGST